MPFSQITEFLRLVKEFLTKKFLISKNSLFLSEWNNSTHYQFSKKSGKFFERPLVYEFSEIGKNIFIVRTDLQSKNLKFF